MAASILCLAPLVERCVGHLAPWLLSPRAQRDCNNGKSTVNNGEIIKSKQIHETTHMFDCNFEYNVQLGFDK